MITKIKSVHEETFTVDEKENKTTLGIILNYSNDFKESFAYIFRNERYIFFNTMIDMMDYLLNGGNKTKKAFMSEEDFDNYYDTKINGTLKEMLNFV